MLPSALTARTIQQLISLKPPLPKVSPASVKGPWQPQNPPAPIPHFPSPSVTQQAISKVHPSPPTGPFTPPPPLGPTWSLFLQVSSSRPLSRGHQNKFTHNKSDCVSPWPIGPQEFPFLYKDLLTAPLHLLSLILFATHSLHSLNSLGSILPQILSVDSAFCLESSAFFLCPFPPALSTWLALLLQGSHLLREKLSDFWI